MRCALEGLITSLVSRKIEEVGIEEGESRVWKKEFRDKGPQWENRGKNGSLEVRDQVTKSKIAEALFCFS